MSEQVMKTAHAHLSEVVGLRQISTMPEASARGVVNSVNPTA
jgi:hypothetical protein